MIMDHKLKLMVVDDSPLFRTWLIHSLSEDDRFQVVGYAVNAPCPGKDPAAAAGYAYPGY